MHSQSTRLARTDTSSTPRRLAPLSVMSVFYPIIIAAVSSTTLMYFSNSNCAPRIDIKKKCCGGVETKINVLINNKRLAALLTLSLHCTFSTVINLLGEKKPAAFGLPLPTPFVSLKGGKFVQCTETRFPALGLDRGIASHKQFSGNKWRRTDLQLSA